MGAVAGLFGGSGPTYNTVDLDSGTKDLIHGQVERNAVPTSQVTDRLNSGVGKTTDAVMGAGGKEQALSPDDHMKSAIVNKYHQEANKQIGMLQQAQGLQAPLTQGNWLSQAYQAIQAQQQVEVQNNEFLTQAYIDSQKARAQAMSSIFGAAGGLAGMGAAQGWFKGHGHRGGDGFQEPGIGGPQGGQSYLNAGSIA